MQVFFFRYLLCAVYLAVVYSMRTFVVRRWWWWCMRLGRSRRLTTTFQSGRFVLVGRTRGARDILPSRRDPSLPRAVTSGPMTSHLSCAAPTVFFFIFLNPVTGGATMLCARVLHPATPSHLHVVVVVVVVIRFLIRTGESLKSCHEKWKSN